MGCWCRCGYNIGQVFASYLWVGVGDVLGNDKGEVGLELRNRTVFLSYLNVPLLEGFVFLHVCGLCL